MRILKGHEAAVRCLSYSPDGQLLVSGDEASGLRLWSLPSGDPVGEPVRENSSIECVAFSPLGRSFAAGLQHAVLVRNADTLEIIAETHGHAGGTRGLAWNSNGSVLASCGWDHHVSFWTPDLAQRWPALSVQEPMMALAFTPDGQRLALAGNNGALKLAGVPRSSTGEELRHDRPLYSVACSPDDNLVAAGDNQGHIILWDTSGGTTTRTLHGHEWTVYGLAFTPNGNCVVSGSADGTVRLWEVSTSRLVETYRWFGSWVNCVAVSPDGMTAAAGSADGTIVVWDLADV